MKAQRFVTVTFGGVALVFGLVVLSTPGFAQAPLPTPQAPPSADQPAPSYPPAELDRIVSPIALYPDPLLAQVLTAATFPADIPDAARWADDHHYLSGRRLTDAIAADQLPWDPSVQALLPFPSVLEMMASSMPWTQELGVRNVPWGRTWVNRGPSVRPRAVPPRAAPQPPDRHPAKPRTPHERERERPKGGSKDGTREGRGK